MSHRFTPHYSSKSYCQICMKFEDNPIHKEGIPTKPRSQSLADRGTAQRVKDYSRVYRATGDHRAAIRSYCAGNKWLEANAKAVGNW